MVILLKNRSLCIHIIQYDGKGGHVGHLLYEIINRTFDWLAVIAITCAATGIYQHDKKYE
jgi:hypothetical protein